jgi:nucleoside-diphosphate-sugar epimerase
MSILLTGVTGFLGKVLLWKILDDNQYDKIFVFIRTKKGVSPQERLEKIAMGRDCSNIHVLPFDLSELNEDSFSCDFFDSVQHVIHSAASVSFNNPFLKEYQENVTNTMNLLNSVVTKCNNLKSFVHISTAFVQPRDEKNLLKNKTNEIIETNDHHLDTYTQTKNICEHALIRECAQKNIDLKIIRPSIIGPSLSFPYNGFVDNYLASTGAVILYKQGVFKIISKRHTANIIPVDIVVDCILFVVNTNPKDRIIPCVSPFNVVADDSKEYLSSSFIVNHKLYKFTSAIIDRSKILLYSLKDKRKSKQLMNALDRVVNTYPLHTYTFTNSIYQVTVDKNEYISNSFFPGIDAFMKDEKIKKAKKK